MLVSTRAPVPAAGILRALPLDQKKETGFWGWDSCQGNKAPVFNRGSGQQTEIKQSQWAQQTLMVGRVNHSQVPPPPLPLLGHAGWVRTGQHSQGTVLGCVLLSLGHKRGIGLCLVGAQCLPLLLQPVLVLQMVFHVGLKRMHRVRGVGSRMGPCQSASVECGDNYSSFCFWLKMCVISLPGD